MTDPAAQAVEGTPLDEEPTEGTEPTTDFEAEATEYRKRFSGSQKALNEALAEKKQLAAEAEALRKFKAEAERASMTELERLQAERDEARREAAEARTEAQRATLARKFPLSFEALGDAVPLSEEALAVLEAKLASTNEQPEPRIDPNRPRRTVPIVDDEAARRLELDQADQAFRATFDQGF